MENNRKIFKDPVHGYINVPIGYVKYIIDTSYFQRLRNIEQTGMRVLYPTAKHDRFSHSLGVFQLGQRALEALRKDSQNKIENFERYEILFLIACLLHDIGHTPFSHSLEEQVLANSKFKEHKKGRKSINDKETNIKTLLIGLINDNEKIYCEKAKINQIGLKDIYAAPHEQLGSYLIFNKFKDKIKAVESFYGKYEDDLVFNDDLCFIVRMIMGVKYNEWSAERQIRNVFIELLNGDNFDVDKLDYIVRDTQMSGINSISVDVERLLGSLCVVEKTMHLNKFKLKKENIKNLTITEISNNAKNSEFKITGEFKGIIKVFANSNVEIYENSHIQLFKGVKEELAVLAYTSGDHAIFTSSTKLKLNNEIINEDNKTGYEFKVKELIGKSNKSEFNTYIENAELLSSFKFKAKQDLEIHIFGHCDLKINGRFESIDSLKVFSLSKLEGEISKVEIMGDTFKEKFTSNKESSEVGYNTFSIGFKKQATNVIANVLEARNYLYLWFYAHHKVVYYANFLIPVITKKISEFCGKNQAGFPSWQLDYNNLDKLDDYYLWTIMKYIYYEKKNKSIKYLIDQLFSRKYSNSLYKSLAEFELTFDSFTIEERVNALKLLRTKTDKKKPFLGKNTKDYKAGYLNEDSLEIINKYINDNYSKEEFGELKLSELLYIITEFKQKNLNPNKVYLDMGEEILPISQIPLLFKSHMVSSSADNYFYIYYKVNGDNYDDSPKKVYIIKEAIKAWMKQKEGKKDGENSVYF